METIDSVLKKTIAFLEEKGFDEARTTAELLLAHALSCRRIDLYLRFDKPLEDTDLARYRDFLRRRLKHEPTQYIMGSTGFYALDFKTTPAALIPRPDTEHLVAAAIEEAGKIDAENGLRAWDIGTGSGIIPIAVANNLDGISFLATDISGDALTLAAENAALHGCEERIEFQRHDILQDEPPGTKFDLIVSNPPYIPESEYRELQPEITEYEPKIAASDGADGLTFFRRIAAVCPERLTNEGRILVEIMADQGEDVRSIFKDAGLRITRTVRDYGGIERVIVAKLR